MAIFDRSRDAGGYAQAAEKLAKAIRSQLCRTKIESLLGVKP